MASSPSNVVVASVGNAINLLPTGTVFLFQFLNPILTNTAECSAANKSLTGTFLALLAFFCSFSCFTDGYVGTDGKTHYGLVTPTGLLPFDDPGAAGTDFSGYKLRFSDFVYGFFSLAVFAVVSLLDPNTVSCFYPSFDTKALLMALPVVVGTVAVGVAVVIPTTRHGVGYLASSPA